MCRTANGWDIDGDRYQKYGTPEHEDCYWMFCDYDDVLDDASETLEDMYDEFEDDYGKNWKVSYKITDKEKADKKALRKIEKEPKNVNYYLALVNLYLQQKRYDEAQEARKRLVKAYDKSSKWYAKNRDFADLLVEDLHNHEVAGCVGDAAEGCEQRGIVHAAVFGAFKIADHDIADVVFS